jgi:uncharacterized protein
MNTVLFAPWHELIGGLFVGIIFGFLLRKGYVTRFNVIVNQLLLKDFTVMKIMLTAIAFGSLGIYSLLYLFPTKELIINSTTLLTALLGGGIFGIGMAIMGFCPGTAVGALADGARDMWFGFLGMIVGAAVYAESFGWITKNIKPFAAISKKTLPMIFDISPWFIIGLIFCGLFVLLLFDRSSK